MDRMVVSLWFTVFIVPLLIPGAFSVILTFKNNCPYTIWPATLAGGGTPQLSNTGFQLDKGASYPINYPAGKPWSGRMWARTLCTFDASGRFSCLTGDCATGQLSCNGAGGKPPATLIEFTLFGDGGKDFYDVSNVDGFNLPLSIEPKGGSGNCTITSCSTNINSMCPGELQVKATDGSVIGCKSACEAFGSDQYCCKGMFVDPPACAPTYYSKIFEGLCPMAYSYAHADGTSTFTCTGADYVFTFCP